MRFFRHALLGGWKKLQPQSPSPPPSLPLSTSEVMQPLEAPVCGAQSLTGSRPIGLSKIARWGHGRHHQVEGDGNVHGGDMAGPGTDHPDLVVGLEVHVGGPA